MASLDLVGQVVTEIDHKVVLTVTNLNSRKSTPTTVKKGALGPIGTSQGVADVSGSFHLAIPKTGTEVNLELLGLRPTGFTITYQLGANRYALEMNEGWFEKNLLRRA